MPLGQGQALIPQAFNPKLPEILVNFWEALVELIQDSGQESRDTRFPSKDSTDPTPLEQRLLATVPWPTLNPKP